MKTLTPQEAVSWQGRFVDVRNLDEFAGERLAGAACVPMDRLMSAAGAWDPAEPILLTCQMGVRAAKAAGQLEQVGFKDVHIVQGGLNACKEAGLEVVRTGRGMPLQQQVMIGAGSVLLTGLILSVVVHPWFLAIDWFAASMLLVAGISGFCPMAKILGRMPWNRTADCSSGSCSVTKQAGA